MLQKFDFDVNLYVFSPESGGRVLRKNVTGVCYQVRNQISAIFRSVTLGAGKIKLIHMPVLVKV